MGDVKFPDCDTVGDVADFIDVLSALRSSSNANIDESNSVCAS
jgi:hypothetical protein